MQITRFAQPHLNVCGQLRARQIAPLPSLAYTASSGILRASKANIEHAFASVSSVLGLEAAEDARKSQHSRTVAAQATLTPSYYAREDITVGEVDFDPSLVNSIQVLGNLGGDVDFKVLATNKVAVFSLAITNKKREADWVEVETWGSLADSASQELAKGMQVSVQGRLRQVKWTDPSGHTRSRLKVVARAISKVRRVPNYQAAAGAYDISNVESPSSAIGIDQTSQDQPYQPMDQEYAAPTSSTYYPQDAPRAQTAYRSSSSEEKWQHFFQNRSRYWDNRRSKRNPKAPDFKHMDSAQALWLNSAPQWAHDELNEPEAPVF